MAIRGEPACGRDQSRHNLVSGRSKDPNHDAVMRIGSEAPKRRTHSSSRHESQGACRDSATSNRHRRPITSGRTAETVGVSSTSSVHCVAGRKTTPSGTTPSRTSRHRAISSLRAMATIMGLRVPRAFSVRARNHSSRRCPSGVEGTATPIESCLVGPGHCPNGPALSPGVSSRFRRASQ